MTETSYFWSGTTVGDATLAPYSADVFAKYIEFLKYGGERVLNPRAEYMGVVWDYANNLAPSNPVGTTVRIGTGAAWVAGSLYVNDANIDTALIPPGAGTEYYTFVLRKDWATQTITMEVLGPSAVGYPSPTQTDGVTWEIPLARASLTNVPVLTITDYRVAEPTSVIPSMSHIIAGDAAVSSYGNDLFAYYPNGRVGGLAVAVIPWIGQWTGGAASNGTIALPTEVSGFHTVLGVVATAIYQANGSDVVCTWNPGTSSIHWIDISGDNHTEVDITALVIVNMEGPLSGA